MKSRRAGRFTAVLIVSGAALVASQGWTPPAPRAPYDAVMDAQTPRNVPVTRPEQQKNQHDLSEVFKATSAEPSSTAFTHQPKEGKNSGFDFYRAPLNSDRPMTTFQEVYSQDVADKPKVMQTQRRLLEMRYDLVPRVCTDVRMTRASPSP